MEITKVEFKKDEELAIFYFDQMLKLGFGKLTISYAGFLNDKMAGFYRAKYKHSLTKEPYTATTQFEVFACLIYFKVKKV